jgi:hypothetical protein
MYLLYLIYKNVYLFVCMYVHTCMYVWNLCKFTFLNRSEPNFAHVSPWSGMYGPEILDLFDFFGHFLWGPLQNHGHKMAASATVICDALLSVIPAGVCVTSRHYVVADGGVIRGSLISVILAGVSLTLQKLRRGRRQPQRRNP